MKPFTDEDLKRLKKAVAEQPPFWEDIILTEDGGERFYLQALIARLEAAEEFINKSFMPVEYEDYPDYKEWRKAAGK